MEPTCAAVVTTADNGTTQLGTPQRSFTTTIRHLCRVVAIRVPRAGLIISYYTSPGNLSARRRYNSAGNWTPNWPTASTTQRRQAG